MSEFKDISTKNLLKSITRLTTLADYLRDHVKNPRFALETFLGHPEDSLYGDAEELKKTRKQLKEGFCGTTACAIGHACMIPEFQKAGLKVRIIEPSWGGGEHALACSYKGKDGEIHEDFRAAEEFFKISEHRAEQLFSPDGYGDDAYYTPVSKTKVVKAIRDYIYRAKKHLAKREIAGIA